MWVLWNSNTWLVTTLSVVEPWQVHLITLWNMEPVSFPQSQIMLPRYLTINSPALIKNKQFISDIAACGWGGGGVMWTPLPYKFYTQSSQKYKQ